MSRLAHRRRAEGGAAALEFALVLPILILIVLGIVEFGFAFNTQIALTQAAREGVRVEALSLEVPGGGDGGTVAEEAFIAGNLGSEPVGNVVAGCNGANGDAEVSLTIGTYDSFVLPDSIVSGFDLSGRAVMRCGG